MPASIRATLRCRSPTPRGRARLASRAPNARCHTTGGDKGARSRGALLRASGLTTSGAAARSSNARRTRLASSGQLQPLPGRHFAPQLKERPKKEKLPPDSPLMGYAKRGEKK